jgi:ATP-dependent RNA helicase DDX49/DBP8
MAPKRKRVTADDLLRLQEQANSLPKKKRPQGTWSAEESDYEKRDSELEEQTSDSDSHQSELEENTQLPSPNELSRLERISLRNSGSDSAPPIAGPSSFRALNISPPLISALAAMSIRHPTEIQSACIPPLLAGKLSVDIFWSGMRSSLSISGRDCIGNAKTGSGKTIAFALPILRALSRDPYGIYALVLTPTRYAFPSHPLTVCPLILDTTFRELAFQIAEQFSVLGLSFGVRTSTVVGGMDMISQALELKEKPHVVVATPGRLVDHLKSTQGEIDLSKVKFLVSKQSLVTPKGMR